MTACSLRAAPLGRLAPLALAAAVLVTGCASFGPVEPLGVWSRASTPTVSVSTDLGLHRAEQLARKLEAFRAAAGEVLPDLRRERGVPLPIWVFASSREYRAYAQALNVPAGAASFFVLTSRGGAVFADAGAQGTDLLGMLYHEMLHDLIARTRPGMPLWLNEGLAELFQRLRTDGHVAALGGGDQAYLELVRGAGLGAPSRWMRATPRSPAYREPVRKSLFHARAWLAVHYLVVGRSSLAKHIPSYLDRIESGAPADVAFRGAFGFDLETLARRLEGYARRQQLPTRRFRVLREGDAPEIDTNRLEDPRVLAALGWVLYRAGIEDLAFVEAHFRQALELRPTHRRSLVGLARIFQEQGKRDEQVELLRRLRRAQQ
jgi:hypothetical protein